MNSKSIRKKKSILKNQIEMLLFKNLIWGSMCILLVCLMAYKFLMGYLMLKFDARLYL